MSWPRRIQTPYIITTGDGQRYTPKWMNAALVQEYNVSKFEFPNIPGTLVRKNEPKGRVFSLELMFDGDNHLDVAERFRISANDKRPWTITHPFYDNIVGHPTKLQFDNTDYNVSRITGPFIETIGNVFPTGSATAEDQALADKEALNELTITAYSGNVNVLPVSEIGPISDSIDILDVTTEAIIETDEEAFNFRNTVVDAKAALDTAIGQPLALLREVQEVIDFPFRLANSVRQRVTTLIDQFNRVLESLGNLTDFSRERKSYYEAFGTTLVSAIAASAVTPQDGDYQSDEDVNLVINDVLNTYNSFIENLDTIQTPTATQEDAYTPNADAMFALEKLINLTVGTLFQIAFEQRSEFVIFLESETNIIELTSRLYGIDADDERITELLSQNNMGLTEYLTIPKGRRIVYYVA